MPEQSARKSAGSAARRSYHHGDLRRAIEETTLAVIESDGLEAVSLRAIARRLGVSEAAPYHHFAGKQELLAVLAADAYRGFHGRMLAALESASVDPFERLAAIGGAYVDYALENRGRFRLMFGAHMVDLAAFPEVYEAGHPTRVLLSEVVAGCVAGSAVDSLLVEQAAWALFHGIASLTAEDELRFDDGSTGVERLTVGAIDLLIRGVLSLRAAEGR